MMDFFRKIIRSERGFLPIIAFGTIIAVTAGWLYLAGTTAQRIRETSGRDLENFIANPDQADPDAAHRHRQNVATFSQVLGQTGSLVNTAVNVVRPGGGAELDPTKTAVVEAVRTGVGTAIDYSLNDNRTNPPPSSSRPLPSDVNQPPSCSRSSLSGCTDRSSCSNAGGTWQPNNTCDNKSVPQCRRNNLSACTTRSDCEMNGGYWYDNKCNSSPKCDSNNLKLCKTKEECNRNGGFWYDDHCNVSPQECYSIDVTLCKTQIECEAGRGYWYDGACHKEPKCADRGGVCYCESGEEICCADVCNRTPNCRDGSDEWTCDCDESGIFVCANGKKICRSKVCNNKDDCGDNSDENNCSSRQSCCIVTNGCPGETAYECAENCCCCPLHQVCDRVNLWNGCITVGSGMSFLPMPENKFSSVCPNKIK